VLGLLLGLGVAFLLERLDRRIREPKDLEAIYGLPLLGVVPESAALSRSAQRKRDAQGALPAGESESFQLIRAHLRYFNVDRELRTLLIASAAPGDGKTTIARHLAGAAQRSVLLRLRLLVPVRTALWVWAALWRGRRGGVLAQRRRVYRAARLEPAGLRDSRVGAEPAPFGAWNRIAAEGHRRLQDLTGICDVR
jgi:hypothetical protein